MNNVFRLGLLCLGVALASCGTTDPTSPPGSMMATADCSVASACGGDPSGAWKITATCGDPQPDWTEVKMKCPTFSSTRYMSVASGTLSFGTDKTASANMELLFSGENTVPAACIVQPSCPASDEDQTCTGDIMTACVCRSHAKSVSKETGVWSTTGSTLTTTVMNGGDAGAHDYCVVGNALRIRVTDELEIVAVKM